MEGGATSCWYRVSDVQHGLPHARDDPDCLRIPPSAPREPARAADSSTSAARIAICVAGAPRTFTRAHVRDSIVAMLLNPLRLDAAVDLYASLVMLDARPPHQYDQPDWSATPISPAAAEVGAALAPLQPRALALVQRSEVPANPRCDLGGYLAAPAHAERFMAQWRTLGRCLPLLERAELIDQRGYTHVVRTRPDLYWAAPHPPIASWRANSSLTDSRHPQVGPTLTLTLTPTLTLALALTPR